MEKLRLTNDIIKLLNRIDIPFAIECRACILNSLVRINAGFCMDGSHVYDTYSVRQGIQSDVTKSNVEGYDFVLEKLRKHLSDQIRVSNVTFQEGSYTLFSDADFQQLFGVLKSPYFTLEDSDKYESELRSKSIISKSFKVNKGEVMQ